MKRHLSYALIVILLVFVGLSAFTPGLAHVVWSGIAWAVLGTLVILATGLVANLLYAFFSIEMGYDPKSAKPKRPDENRHLPHRLRAVLHAGTLRHR